MGDKQTHTDRHTDTHNTEQISIAKERADIINIMNLF
jgi:hypothetical protein